MERIFMGREIDLPVPALAVVLIAGAPSLPLVWLELPREYYRLAGVAVVDARQWATTWEVAPVRMALAGQWHEADWQPKDDAGRPQPVPLIMRDGAHLYEPARLAYNARRVHSDGVMFMAEFTMSRHDYNELCVWWDRVSK